MLDVVNEHNQVIGQATRQEIHENRWLHRAVHLLLVSPNRHFLLQQRADSRPTYPGRWDTSAAGHVAAGESCDATIIREAREEIGYNISSPTPPLLVLDGSPETDYEWVHFYAQELESRPNLRADPDEVKDLRWWPEDELLQSLVHTPDLFTPAFRILFFLWRQTGFLVPIPQPDGWYLIVQEASERAEVQRGFLESAGLPARVNGKDHWADPNGGRSFFDRRRILSRQGLCVPPETLAESVALLFLSEPLEEENPAPL